MPLVGTWSFLARLYCRDFLNSYYCIAKVFIFHFIPKISSLIGLRRVIANLSSPSNDWIWCLLSLHLFFYFVLAANAPLGNSTIITSCFVSTQDGLKQEIKQDSPNFKLGSPGRCKHQERVILWDNDLTAGLILTTASKRFKNT